MTRRSGVIQVPLNRIVLCSAPLRIEMLICRIADREARDRGTRECRILIPAFKVVTGARCRCQGNIGIQNRVAYHGVRIGRRVPRRCAVIQRICNRIAVSRTPLCVVVLCLRIHRRETGNRGTRERSIVIPAFKGIAIPTCGQEAYVAAAVGEHRIAREICCRIACRVTRRASVVQCIYNRIGNRRAAPLRIILFVLGIHGAKVRNRGSREARIVIPAEEAIACARCRMDGDLRVFDRVVRNRVRIGRRMTRRGSVIQVPLNRIVLCRTPFCIVMLILGITDRKASNRRTCKRRILVPTEEVITRASRRGQGDIRINYGIARHCVRIGRGVSRRRSVIQRILHRIGKRCAPLCIEGLGCRIHGRKTADCRARKARIVVPALEAVARSQRICNRNRVRQGLNRVARQIDRRIGRRMARAVIQHIVDRIALRRTPLCIVILICRIHGVKRGNRCARKARVIIPTLKGITGSGRRHDCEIRLGDIVAELRVRVRRRVSRRRRIIQMIGDTVGIRCAPSRVVVLILRVHGVEIRDRRAREGGIRIPAEETVTRARRRLNCHVGIEHGVSCHRVRVGRRMTRRRAVV